MTAFWYLEDAEGILAMRQISGGCATELKRPTSFQLAQIPPFNPTNPEPHLCFLSGLAELCRNAAKAVLNASPQHDRPHIDFEVDVSRDVTFKATVTIFNAVVGNQCTPSQSVGILADLFRRLNNIVELEQTQVLESYPYALSGGVYVSSRFLFYPKRIGVAASHTYPREAI